MPQQRDQLDDLIERFETASIVTARAIGHHVAAQIDSEITMPQFYIMRLLGDVPSRRVTEIAEMLEIKPSAVTAMADRLEAKGWIVRERDEADRRIVNVSLSAEGRDELAAVSDVTRRFVRALFGQLDPTEVETMVLTYEKLRLLVESSSCPHPHHER
jgi:DNA-binding MarR family transcriptional regulator